MGLRSFKSTPSGGPHVFGQLIAEQYFQVCVCFCAQRKALYMISPHRAFLSSSLFSLFSFTRGIVPPPLCTVAGDACILGGSIFWNHPVSCQVGTWVRGPWLSKENYPPSSLVTNHQRSLLSSKPALGKPDTSHSFLFFPIDSLIYLLLLPFARMCVLVLIGLCRSVLRRGVCVCVCVFVFVHSAKHCT